MKKYYSSAFDGLTLRFFELITWDGDNIMFADGTTVPADTEKLALEIIMAHENAERWLPKSLGSPFWREWLIERIRQAQDQLSPDRFGSPYPYDAAIMGSPYYYRIATQRFWCKALELFLAVDYEIQDMYRVGKRDDWRQFPLVFDWWRSESAERQYTQAAYVVEGTHSEYEQMEIEFFHLWNNICDSDVWRSESEHDAIKASFVEMGSTFAANLHTPQPELFDAL